MIKIWYIHHFIYQWGHESVLRLCQFIKVYSYEILHHMFLFNLKIISDLWSGNVSIWYTNQFISIGTGIIIWNNFNSSQIQSLLMSKKEVWKMIKWKTSMRAEYLPHISTSSIRKAWDKVQWNSKIFIWMNNSVCRNIFFCKRSDNYSVNWFNFLIYLYRDWWIWFDL